MHRRAYVVLFIAVFASTLGVGFIGPLMPLYARDLGATGLALGMIFSGFSMARFVFTPLIGRLSDSRGRRVFLASGLATFAAFSFAYIAAKTAGQLILVRVLHGAAAGMVIPIAQAYIGDISPKGSEGSYMGTFTVSLFAAFGIGPLLGGPLAERFGQQAPFLAMGSLSIIALMLTVFLLPELGLHRSRGASRVPYGIVLGETMVVALLLFRSVVAFGRGLVIPFLPFVAESLGASLGMIGVLLAANILTAAVMQVPFGKLADRVSKPLLIASGMLGSAFVIYLIPHARTVTSLFVLQIATGAVTALGFPAALALAAQYGKRFRAMGTMMGLFSGGMSVGLILGPLLGGTLKGIFGLDFVFKGGSLVVAAGFIAFVLLSFKAARRGCADRLGEQFEARSGEASGLASAASVRSDYSGGVSSKERV